MASSLYSDLRLNSSIELASKSKSLIPEIKNWCAHIKINSEYGGLIGEMGLPTMNFVSCSQANGGGAMNLEWVSHDFVIQNCQNCMFHKEVFPKNFGRKTIEQYKQYKQKHDSEKQKEEAIVNEVKSKLKGKIVDRFKTSKTTEVSILKLLDKLTNSDDKLYIVESVLESSKLKPEFFNALALDYLVLFLNDENISPEISETIYNVVHFQPSTLSDFSKERIKDSIARGENHNILIRLVKHLLLQEKEEILLLDILLKNYTVEDIRGYVDPFENFAPSIIQYFRDFQDRKPEEFRLFMLKSLTDNRSSVRKNTSYILYQLYLLDKSIALPFLETMVDAFNIYEDEQGGADWAICSTLVKFCYADCSLVLSTIEKCSEKLSNDGKVQILKFYDEFIETDDLRESFPDEVGIIIDKIIAYAGKNEMGDIIDNPHSVLRDLTRQYPSLFSSKFEVLIGFLIGVIKEKSKFNWYKDNLDNNTTTFNPLTSLNIYDIMSKETKISTKISNVSEMISNVLKENQNSHFTTILKIIRNLDSKKEEDKELKIYLIAAIRLTKCSNINLVHILPDIYNWILDINALAVRMEALKLLGALVKNHFEILPQTLIDLLKILINDTDIIIKKYAIDAYGEILSKRPDTITDEMTTFLMDQYDSRYIGIHEAMSGITISLYNLLPPDKQKELYRKIFLLLHSHSREKDKRQELYERLFRQVLFLNRKINPENVDSYEKNLVVNYLLPDCDTDDFYKSENAIKILTELRRKNDSLNDVWLGTALNFIYKYPPQRHEIAISNSFRKDYYREMYDLKRSDVSKEFKGMCSYLKKHLENIDLYDFDVINILNLLGYFSLHSEILELYDIITLNVNEVPSRKFLFRVLNDHKILAGLMESNRIKF